MVPNLEFFDHGSFFVFYGENFGDLIDILLEL